MNKNYLIVPYTYFQNENLSLSDALVLSEIVTLSRQKGFCYASNGWLAERLGLSLSTVKASLVVLKRQNLIELKKDGKRREIYADKKVIAEFDLEEDKNQPDSGQNSASTRSESAHNNKRDNKRDNKSDNRAKKHKEIDYRARGYDIEELEKIR